MSRLFHAVFAASALLLPVSSASAADAKAVHLLREAIDAQGGEKALRAVRTVQWQAQGYRNMLEQSERPEGPYIPEFRVVSEVHDFGGNRYRSSVELTVSPQFKGSTGILADGGAAVSVFGGRMSVGSASTLATAREMLALSPEHLLITALEAKDARLEPSTLLQSVPQDVVAFTYDGAPVRLFLNHYTHLPTAVDYSGPAARDGYWQFLGDATMRTYFSFWWLGEGIRLPMQWDIYRNGLHDSSYTIGALSINAPVAEADMRIPDALRAKFVQAAAAAAPSPVLRPAVDIAPGVVQIPGSWNVLLVRQDDGVVVVEAPISSAYSELVLAEARRLYPNLPVKAVVTTSDAWPHIAGLRPYVARGIPVYCLSLNVPILTRLVQAHYSARPDLLERTPRKAVFRPVDSKLELGSGANRIDLYPMRGESSERQMMAYLPALRLLYGSDSFQPSGDGGYDTPQTVSELMDAVSREGLAPERFLMMHVEITPWADLRKAAALEHHFPDGKPG